MFSDKMSRKASCSVTFSQFVRFVNLFRLTFKIQILELEKWVL